MNISADRDRTIGHGRDDPCATEMLLQGIGGCGIGKTPSDTISVFLVPTAAALGLNSALSMEVEHGVQASA